MPRERQRSSAGGSRATNITLKKESNDQGLRTDGPRIAAIPWLNLCQWKIRCTKASLHVFHKC
jgi:hypothetical protein